MKKKVFRLIGLLLIVMMATTSLSFAATSKQTPITKPAVTVKNIDNNYLKVSWSKRTKAVKYNVYRATSKSGTYKKIAATTRTYYNDKTVDNNKTYYYKVKALGKSSKYNSKMSIPKSGKISFAGEIRVSKEYFNLTPENPSFKIYVKGINTEDDLTLAYDDYYIELEIEDANETGWYPITVTCLLAPEDYYSGEETEIELYFEKHERLYKKIITVYFFENEGDLAA
ncbi:MAG: hypothetical protein HFE72_00985 [Emergencia sp.]|nr:hypothetical protein [Emergencia sp.]